MGLVPLEEEGSLDTVPQIYRRPHEDRSRDQNDASISNKNCQQPLGARKGNEGSFPRAFRGNTVLLTPLP